MKKHSIIHPQHFYHTLLLHIHPIMVHFPIALIIIATCYDLFWLVTKRRFSPKKGFWTIAFISAWIAIGTGPEHDARGNTNVKKTPKGV
ncbi:DUF2231 domain-containing protein [Neobacillus sp. C211]|uniref:DUF2231 domain-containing protein n=1 Tax=unclassified Neobacillus TaxID=2675272 RepID=UPI00397882D9